MAKHNKKRNVGLLHEQLVRHASQMTVENKSRMAEKAISILTENFKKDTHLLKEFKLFSALVHTRVSSKDIARRIIEESRRACSDHDAHKLQKEKSKLIREINHSINRKDFYNQRVDNYKIFATVQALLNEWRGKNFLSPDERVQYELVLENHLTREEKNKSLEPSKDANPLVFSIMVEKFNKKYAKELTKTQHDLLVTRLSGDNELLERKINLVHLEAKKAINEFFKDCDNEVLLSKESILRETVESFAPSSTEKSLIKALMMSDLIKELEEVDGQ